MCIKGYKIPLFKKPKKADQVFVSRMSKSRTTKKEDIELLLAKGVIIECKNTKDQFISPHFVVQKADGSSRFILNLKKFNKYVSKEHFKMENLKITTKLISPGDFMATIDLQDAYLTIPVHKNSQKYLRFKFGNKLYQFVCLPFGLSTSPFAFTKLLKPVMRFLRKRGYISGIYLDDLLCIGNTYEECEKNVKETISLLQKLGFIINYKKSKLIPSTSCTYLGAEINSNECIIKLTKKKRENIIKNLKELLEKESWKIVEFAKVIGKLVAACPMIEYGWLYTKAMEREKLYALNKSQGNYNKYMTISEDVKTDINWWLQKIPKGFKCFKPIQYKITIFTDASLSGWGATDGSRSIHGVWDHKENPESINYYELMAVKLALEQLCDKVYDSAILLRIDNRTAISYVNRMGGVKIKKFNKLARTIWEWAENRNILLKATYIPSNENKEADALSRLTNNDAEWELKNVVYKQIVNEFGVPKVDLFASSGNSKCPLYFSWLPDPEASQIDAFTVFWGNLEFYAFPPFVLIPQVLQKIIQDQATGILIVPRWLNQAWFPLFNKLIKSKVLCFGPSNNLLTSVCRKTHPRAKHLQLLAAIVSGKRLKEYQ